MIRQRQGRWLLKSFTLGFAVTAGLMGADFEWNLPKGYDAGGKTDHPNKSRILRPFPLTVARSTIWLSFLGRSPTKSCCTILAGATLAGDGPLILFEHYLS
jgi:hypothetical protein